MKNLANYLDDFFEEEYNESCSLSHKFDNKKDRIKAMRKANRDIEFETRGPGFHSNSQKYKDKSKYSRKDKHKHKNN